MSKTRNAPALSVAGVLAFLALSWAPHALAIDSRFTYQGHLTDVAQAGPANGAYDLEFTLQDTAGATVGAPLVVEDAVVVAGVFTVELDFGAVAFSGADRFLRIGVRRGDETGAFTALLPRSAVTPAPYAQASAVAEFAASIANDSVAGAQVVDGSVGDPDIDASMQRRVSGTCPDGEAIRVVSANGTVTCAAGLQGEAGPAGDTGPAGPAGPEGPAGSADAWSRVGNSGTSPSTNFIGTLDAQPFELRADNRRVARFERNAVGAVGTANVLLGSAGNAIDAGVRGATVSGGGMPGGDPDFDFEGPNRVSDHYGAVGGGYANVAGSVDAVFSDAAFATVAGGSRNRATAQYASIGGGVNNVASGEDSRIGGGAFHTATGDSATVAGGAGNDATGDYATIGGGYTHAASGEASVIGGGNLNVASALYSTVGGGRSNAGTGGKSTVAGGGSNVAGGFESTIGGGLYNYATGDNTTIAGGRANSAAAQYASIGGGSGNCAGGEGSWAGGSSARVRIPTGYVSPGLNDACENVAPSGDAGGDEGTFVWSDRPTQGSPFTSTGPNQFAIRARGGVRLSEETSQYFGATGRQMINLFNEDYGIGVQTSTMYFRTNARFAWFDGGSHAAGSLDPGAGGALLMTLGTGTGLPTGTARAQLFTSVSDRNAKTGFEAIDVADILAGVLALPLSEWSYRNATGERHIGPMAQDFRAAFGLGSDDKSIATIDADGVALAAIQGLNQRLEAEIASRDAELAAMRAEIAALRDMMRAGSR